ncbi:autotransporter outer membrane beta-barrel domain-containing protein [Mailhella sp.]|uniref:autotransporter outer membrane beta-barrel domain-containing protein n=1 Tax=Mailhella sp. TaxID=1981029 RepID=UPI0040634935
MLTKGAIGNLVNRYRAVLKKCHLMNTFGSLAVASMLILGSAGMAAAEDIITTKTLNTSAADGTYGDVTAAGNIIVFDESKPTGEQAYDILAGNVTAEGYIKAGEITTHGNLTADHVETHPNIDPTVTKSGNPLTTSTENPGTVTINGTVNLPGDNVTSRRFDVFNKVGSHNVIGNVDAGACIGLAGNGSEISTLTAGTLKPAGSFTVVNGMQATVDNVDLVKSQTRKVRVHNDTDVTVATVLDLNTLHLNNGHILTDSDWSSQYAMGVIRNISPDEALPGVLVGNGHIAVGANSMLSLGEGASVHGLYDAMKTYTGQEAPTENGVKAALMLNSPLELREGCDYESRTPTGKSFKVILNGELRTETLKSPYSTTSDSVDTSSLLKAVYDANTFTQGANTLLIVNGANDKVHYATAAKTDVPGAISYVGPAADGDAAIEDGAKLAITGAQAGETYVILGKGFDASSITFGETAWTGDNLLSDNVLVSLTRGDDGTVAADAVAAEEALPGLDSSLAAAIDSANQAQLIGTGEQQTDDGEAGTQFISKALKAASADAATAVDAINEVSRAAVTAGVQNTALRLADAASNTVIDHLSLAWHDASSSIHADGADFWAAPMYGNLYTSGMVADGASVRGQFGGLALGADLEAGQFLGGKFRVGAAINGGGGQSETKGAATVAENDYDFGGINFYAGWNKGALNIIGSVGYGFGNHEVEMGMPASFGMGKAKADIDTTAFTTDLRAEYQLSTQYVDILPHVGVRYTALKTDSYDLKVGGDVLNSVQSETQNIVQFPVGVTLSKDVAFADWSVKPMVDVSVIPAAGDKKASSKVKFSGIDAWSNVNSRIMDSTSWAGTIGIQAEKGSFTLGLNYGVQASSHETDQNVQFKLGWKF